MLRRSYEPDQLLREHPPRLHHPHKRLLFELACPPGAVHSGLIAMAAPSGGQGRYRRDELGMILRTAWIGFAAAVAESRRSWPGARTEIRTGFWGCGALRGNRCAMTLLQLLAARMAGVERVRFHAVDAAGLLDAEAGVAAFARVSAHAADLGAAALIGRVEAEGFEWIQ